MTVGDTTAVPRRQPLRTFSDLSSNQSSELTAMSSASETSEQSPLPGHQVLRKLRERHSYCEFCIMKCYWFGKLITGQYASVVLSGPNLCQCRDHPPDPPPPGAPTRTKLLTSFRLPCLPRRRPISRKLSKSAMEHRHNWPQSPTLPARMWSSRHLPLLPVETIRGRRGSLPLLRHLRDPPQGSPWLRREILSVVTDGPGISRCITNQVSERGQQRVPGRRKAASTKRYSRS